MARSGLTEGLRSLRAQNAPHGVAPAQGLPSAARVEAAKSHKAGSSGDPASEVGLEIRAIFTQEGSFTRERSSFFGCSPPTRSENGLVRDRVFGRCIPITPKSQSLSPSSASALSTA